MHPLRREAGKPPPPRRADAVCGYPPVIRASVGVVIRARPLGVPLIARNGGRECGGHTRARRSDRLGVGSVIPAESLPPAKAGAGIHRLDRSRRPDCAGAGSDVANEASPGSAHPAFVAVSIVPRRAVTATRAQSAPQPVVLATSNAGKLREFARLLAPLGCEVVAQSVFGMAPVEEDGETFIENAILKARAASAASGLPAIADDSGLTVDVLDGAPGVRSARLAGDAASDEENVRVLLSLMDGVPEERRGGCFACVVVYLREARDPLPLIAQGRWRGLILQAPRGKGGFGYDPVFYVPEHGASVAELSPETKNAASHRARAVVALLDACSSALDFPSTDTRGSMFGWGTRIRT